MMPLRLPANYETLSVNGRDPTTDEARDYLAWLKVEVATVEAWLDATAEQYDEDPRPGG